MDVRTFLRMMDHELRFEHCGDLYEAPMWLEDVEAFCADIAEHFDALKAECPDLRDSAIGYWRSTLMSRKSGEPSSSLASSGQMTTHRLRRQRPVEAAGLSE